LLSVLLPDLAIFLFTRSEADSMSEDRNPEASGQFYDGLFPVKGVTVQVRRVGLSFSDLATLFPDRVLLSRLDDIFRAWQSRSHDGLPSDKKVSMAYPAVDTTCRILYDYDKNTYHSTVASIEINARLCLQIQIKLSNDGFIYPFRESLSLNPTYNSGEKHRKRTGWAQLADETIKTHFKSILEGVKSVMGVVASDRIFGQVLYHEFEERVDFLFRNQDESSAHVLVSFEAGFPENFHKDDRYLCEPQGYHRERFSSRLRA
jgi:hypothetical protein